MWSNLLWVGLGGFVGSVLRYGVGAGIAALTAARSGIRFPLATLAVNVAGSLLIGILLRHVEQGSAQHLLGVVGFCGVFTPFSTFSFESVARGSCAKDIPPQRCCTSPSASYSASGPLSWE